MIPCKLYTYTTELIHHDHYKAFKREKCTEDKEVNVLRYFLLDCAIRNKEDLLSLQGRCH